jgi:hypothetical protein
MVKLAGDIRILVYDRGKNLVLYFRTGSTSTTPYFDFEETRKFFRVIV